VPHLPIPPCAADDEPRRRRPPHAIVLTGFWLKAPPPAPPLVSSASMRISTGLCCPTPPPRWPRTAGSPRGHRVPPEPTRHRLLSPPPRVVTPPHGEPPPHQTMPGATLLLLLSSPRRPNTGQVTVAPPRHHADLWRGDRTMGALAAPRAWVGRAIWPLGQAGVARPWANFGPCTVQHFPISKILFPIKISRN
jgi:hypothetical protein